MSNDPQRTQPSVEPSCPSCGETPMFRSQVHECCVRVERVLALCGDETTGWPGMVAKILRGET